MVKRNRKITKIRNYLNSKRLTELLYLAMCEKTSFEELLDWHLPTGYEKPGWFWDKNDQKLNIAFYKKFGDRLMERWISDPGNVGKRPWLFYKVYPEKPKTLDHLTLREYDPELFENHLPYPKDDKKRSVFEPEEDFLRRMGLLEDREEKEILKQKSEGTFIKFKDKLIYKGKKYEKSKYFD